ncbi:hypothetical protein LCGC14_0995010 [marine sediment metagenome]|uniref:Uncharacterized protein n=1 Tax=marine sediment metagenome TaxID=412755 RepID=A0A0F9N990_9ZZZZ
MQELVDCLIAGNKGRDYYKSLVLTLDADIVLLYGIATRNAKKKNWFYDIKECIEFANRYFKALELPEDVVTSIENKYLKEELKGMKGIFEAEQSRCDMLTKENKELEQLNRKIIKDLNCALVRENNCINQIGDMRAEFIDMKKQRDICQQNVPDLWEAIINWRKEYWEKDAECRSLVRDIERINFLRKNS